MLPTFCPPTIWAISLEFRGKPFILEADDFLGACCRKAMTPKKLWTLLFPIKVRQEKRAQRWTFWGRVGWVSSIPRGGGRKVRALLQKFVVLGF